MTVAIYQQLPDGMVRLGTFTVKGHPNARRIAMTFHKKYPKAWATGPLFIATRRKLFGRYCDEDRIPMDPPEGGPR